MVIVVGVAVVHAGRVLAARRAGPGELAGRWELPGGKVEPGERPEDAAVREIREELGCEVEVTGWLEGTSRIRDGLELRVATARLVSGFPVPLEHDAVWWLGPDRLDGVSWAAPDVPFVARLRAVVGARS